MFNWSSVCRELLCSGPADVRGGACKTWCCSGLPAVLSYVMCVYVLFDRFSLLRLPPSIPTRCYGLILLLYHKSFFMCSCCVSFLVHVQKETEKCSFCAFITWLSRRLCAWRCESSFHTFFSCLCLSDSGLHIGFYTSQPPVLGAWPSPSHPSTGDPEVKRRQVALWQTSCCSIFHTVSAFVCFCCDCDET